MTGDLPEASGEEAQATGGEGPAATSGGEPRASDGEPRASGPLDGRFVLLGITGSIAAYKAVELLRLLTGAGARVQVLMTRAATAFVGPLTLETLSGRAVMRDPLELLPDERIGHIVAAGNADAIVVAPATAHWLGSMANGLADDVITATCLATSAPVVVAPAMDGHMYAHPATRANVERLRAFGYTIVEPGVGALASGQTGPGRLAELDQIVAAVERAIREREGSQARESSPSAASSDDPPSAVPAASSSASVSTGNRARDLDGWRIVVTAGGTAEPIDPVRFIGNRSSGKMGVAIAGAATERGAAVTLIVGSTSVPLPTGVRVVVAPTTADMRHAVLEAIPGSDALVMAAAVADFRPAHASARKLTRDAGLALELEPTEDILAEASAWAHAQPSSAGDHPRPLLVGFAAETGALDRAVEKAARKGVDLMVANDVSEPGSGFGTDTNRVTLIVPGEAPEPWPQLSKVEVAHRLLDRMANIRNGAGRAVGASSAASAGTRSTSRSGRAEEDQ
jgi:phosphopantothenoylcysteine decarboxylase / phosphopantothenate---cysteine ligase